MLWSFFNFTFKPKILKTFISSQLTTWFCRNSQKTNMPPLNMRVAYPMNLISKQKEAFLKHKPCCFWSGTYGTCIMPVQVDTLKDRERFLGRMDLFLNEDFPGITITDQQMFERTGKVYFITALLTLQSLIYHSSRHS